jgi:aflatoxin B1 aldehyde reductase
MDNLVLGTMNIEYPYSSLKDKSVESYKSIIQKYISSVNNPILDTAYYYGNTKTEQVLGVILSELDTKPKIATKANPWFENDFTNGILGQLSKENLKKQLNTSLFNLKLDKVDIFYLHCPDYETPLKETLEICDELWRKEKFDYLGISNFSKNQMVEVLEICDDHKFNHPIYYQGMYNLLSRNVEEIFPLLNDHSIEFWGYNPLAGGLLTGKYKTGLLENDSRFKDNKIYQNIFWKSEILEGCKDFFNIGNCTEYSLQWLKKYSKLRMEDKIILGVSTEEQLENNLNIINKNIIYNGERIKYLNNIYKGIKDYSPNYYY